MSNHAFDDRAAPSLWALWFGRAPVTRRAYALTGFGLMALKYTVEVVAVFAIFGAFFDPWMFLVPSLEDRRQLLGENAGTAAIVWAAWTVPFVWIAFSMTVRRALHAGRSAWWSVLIFAPVVNLLAMIAFAAIPAQGERRLPVTTESEFDEDGEVPPPNLIRFAVGFALSLGIAGTMFGISVYGAGEYSTALFFGTPMVMGMTVAVYTYKPTEKVSHLGNALLACLLALVGLLAAGWEGVICLLMAAPIAILLAILGAMFGHAICQSTSYPRRHLGAAVLTLPLWLLLDAAAPEGPIHAVTTSIVVDAPIERVWANVVSFPELPEPEEWYFRAGIACPMRARIDGSGVGATRHCIFTTGTFVEPITVWDEPTHLAFDVREQPAPMFELTPYREIHAPHLDGALRSVRGEFRLRRLADGRTKLSGTTWYRLDMHPRQYWVLWSDWLIHAIHRRVLDHIKNVTE